MSMWQIKTLTLGPAAAWSPVCFPVWLVECLMEGMCLCLGMITRSCCTTPASAWCPGGAAWGPSASWRPCRSVSHPHSTSLWHSLPLSFFPFFSHYLYLFFAFSLSPCWSPLSLALSLSPSFSRSLSLFLAHLFSGIPCLSLLLSISYFLSLTDSCLSLFLMCTCVSVCLCVCACMFVCACLYVCLPVCVCMCVCACACVCACVCVCVCVCVCKWGGSAEARCKRIKNVLQVSPLRPTHPISWSYCYWQTVLRLHVKKIYFFAWRECESFYSILPQQTSYGFIPILFVFPGMFYILSSEVASDNITACPNITWLDEEII